jgi:MFS family permease
MSVQAVIPNVEDAGGKKIKGRWKSALSLSFASMLDNNEGTGFITAMFPLIRAQLGMALGALGWMAAMPKIIAVFFGPFWASIGRKYNRKKVLIFATGIWGLWAVAIGFSQQVWHLFVLVAISLIGATASQPLMQELLMDLFDDKERGKAVSIVYGLAGIVMLPMTAVNAWLAGMANGWRYGFYGAGVLSAISGILIWLFLKDPGRGASDMGVADAEAARKEEYGLVNWQDVKDLFKVKTFVLMLGQRVLSGHLLMLSFGVVFMTDALGIDIQTANLLMMPLFLGALAGMFLFGFIADWIHKKAPKFGRIYTIQAIQFIYAVFAFIMLTANFENKMLYGVIFFFMTFFGSANMGVNRPIVASVIKPELRGTAFALFVSVFEAIAWAIYNVAAGQIGQRIGLKPVFMVVLVGIMLVNTVYISLLYKTYATDVKALDDEIAARRAALVEG